MTFRSLEDGVWVSGQITPADLDAAAALGVRTVISNRPDHEEPQQPTAAEMATEARARGLTFVHAPARGLPGPDVVAAVGDVLTQGEPVLIFCKSGMRSAAAWALATAQTERLNRAAILSGAAAAGYDLSGLPL